MSSKAPSAVSHSTLLKNYSVIFTQKNCQVFVTTLLFTFSFFFSVLCTSHSWLFFCRTTSSHLFFLLLFIKFVFFFFFIAIESEIFAALLFRNHISNIPGVSLFLFLYLTLLYLSFFLSWLLLVSRFLFIHIQNGTKKKNYKSNNCLK